MVDVSVVATDVMDGPIVWTDQMRQAAILLVRSLLKYSELKHATFGRGRQKPEVNSHARTMTSFPDF